MNHRKTVHPSNKTCRNFANGNCKFGVDCWYVHGEQMDTDDMYENFKCNICEDKVKGRSNFMTHKKINHPESLPTCEKFARGQCSRSVQGCWYEHPYTGPEAENPPPTKSKANPPTKSAEKSVFQEALGKSFPPDQLKKMMEMVSNLCSKMEGMEKRFKELMD